MKNRQTSRRNKATEIGAESTTRAGSALCGIALVALAMTHGVRGLAQPPIQPAPGVQWVSDYTHEDDRSESGTYYAFNWNSSLQKWETTALIDQNHGEEQEREDSGEEWWFGHSNYVVADATVAYITAGYNSWPNCFWKGEGCTLSVQNEINGAADWNPNSGEFEKPDHRKGETRGIAARMDLEGHEEWYRHLLPGLMYNAIQDSEGNILVVGIAYTNRYPDDVNITTDLPEDPFEDNRVIRWNNNTTWDMNFTNCSQYAANGAPRMGVVVKLNPQGQIIWTTFVGAEWDAPDAIQYGSYLSDIVEVPGGQARSTWWWAKARRRTRCPSYRWWRA
jgi:hypothetical protein